MSPKRNGWHLLATTILADWIANNVIYAGTCDRLAARWVRDASANLSSLRSALRIVVDTSAEDAVLCKISSALETIRKHEERVLSAARWHFGHPPGFPYSKTI